MASGFQDELRKGFDEPSAELRKTAETIREAATVPGVTTRAKPSAKMAAATAPEATTEPADYPDKPQHNPDVDPVPDLPPGNSVAAPVVAPAATAAAAAGLVGAATDDGSTATDDAADSADAGADEALTVDATEADRRRCDRRRRSDARRATSQPRTTLPATATRPPTSPTTWSTSTTRPPPSVRTSVHDESGPTPRRRRAQTPADARSDDDAHRAPRRAAHADRAVRPGHHHRRRRSPRVLRPGPALPPPAVHRPVRGARRRVLRRGGPRRHRHAVQPRPARGLRAAHAHRHVRRSAARPAGGDVADLALRRAGAEGQARRSTRSRSSRRRWRCSGSAACSPT